MSGRPPNELTFLPKTDEGKPYCCESCGEVKPIVDTSMRELGDWLCKDCYLECFKDPEEKGNL